MTARTIIVCPDSFKGSAEAATVTAAIADAWRAEHPDDRLVLLPMADGGEGTIDSLASAASGAQRTPVDVAGPDGGRVRAHWLRIPGSQGDTAVVELAQTSGITLARPADARAADSRGFGQAIAAALDAGAHRLLLALGGSATSDGGAGALRALGARLLRADGSEIGPGNRGLDELDAVDLTGLRPVPRGGAHVLADVRSPLLGPGGAIAVFGPQKGISAVDAPAAERALERWARHVGRRTGIRPETPGAGAAGGTGFAMLAWGAQIIPGARTVAREIGLEDALATADAVITGEGRYDAQSAQGKVVGEVRALAAARGVPALLIAGAIAGDTSGFAAAASLVDAAHGSTADAIADPVRFTAEATRTLSARFARSQEHV